MEHTFISAFALLFFIIDPIGNIPPVVSVLRDVEPRRMSWIVVRECAIAFAILTLFAFVGRAFMDTLGLTQSALSIGGAIVLLIISIRMMFPSAGSPNGHVKAGDPLVFPIAVPMLAGPSALATVMILVSGEPDEILLWTAAIGLCMVICAVVFVFAKKLQQLVGERVTSAFERLMGLILVVISVQMFLTGIEDYVRHIHVAG